MYISIQLCCTLKGLDIRHERKPAWHAKITSPGRSSFKICRLQNKLCNRNKRFKCRPFVLSFLTTCFNNFFVTLNCADSSLVFLFFPFSFLRVSLLGWGVDEVAPLKLHSHSNYLRQLRAALLPNRKGRELRSIANGTPLPHFHIHNQELWEWGVNKCLSRAVFLCKNSWGRWVWGVGLGCWSAQGRWWEVRGATLLARVNFRSSIPPTFFFFLLC